MSRIALAEIGYHFFFFALLFVMYYAIYYGTWQAAKLAHMFVPEREFCSFQEVKQGLSSKRDALIAFIYAGSFTLAFAFRSIFWIVYAAFCIVTIILLAHSHKRFGRPRGA